MATRRTSRELEGRREPSPIRSDITNRTVVRKALDNLDHQRDKQTYHYNKDSRHIDDTRLASTIDVEDKEAAVQSSRRHGQYREQVAVHKRDNHEDKYDVKVNDARRQVRRVEEQPLPSRSSFREPTRVSPRSSLSQREPTRVSPRSSLSQREPTSTGLSQRDSIRMSPTRSQTNGINLPSRSARTSTITPEVVNGATQVRTPTSILRSRTPTSPTRTPTSVSFSEPSLLSGNIESVPLSSRISPTRSSSSYPMSRSEKIGESLQNGTISAKDGLVAAIAELLSNGDPTALLENYPANVEETGNGVYNVKIEAPSSYQPGSLRFNSRGNRASSLA